MQETKSLIIQKFKKSLTKLKLTFFEIKKKINPIKLLPPTEKKFSNLTRRRTPEFFLSSLPVVGLISSSIYSLSSPRSRRIDILFRIRSLLSEKSSEYSSLNSAVCSAGYRFLFRLLRLTKHLGIKYVIKVPFQSPKTCMKLNKMITSNPISFFILLAIISLLLPTLIIPFWILKIKAIEKEVDLMTKKSHEETWSVIQHAATTLFPMKSSATNLAKLATVSLGKSKTDLISFSHIESQVSPLLFQALLTIPHLSQVSYIRQDGLLFALYSNNQHHIFAIYSNTSFSRNGYSWYTQPIDSDTGKLYGDAVVFPSQVLANETWFQQALNSTNGCASASLGKSLNDVNDLLVLNTAGVDKNGVISLGFRLKSLMNGIKPSGGGLYLATKDHGNVVVHEPEGNKTISFQLWNRNHGPESYHVVTISGTKYILYYSSSLDDHIIGMELVYVLALPYDGIGGAESRMHKNILVFGLLLLSLLFVIVATSIFSFVVLTVRAAKKEMCLKAALIKQKGATQEAERKSMNQSVAFVTASHDIRASLAGIAGLLEMSINEVDDQRSELAKNLKLVQICSGDLYGILNSILDTSKIEAGKMELEEKEFDLTKVVEGVVELFYPVGLKKGVDVILDLQDASLTKYSHHVKGDEGRLKQILSNLLNNAIKFTSEGNVSVRAWSRKRGLRYTHDEESTGGRGGCRCLFFNKTEARIDEFHDDPNSMEFVFEVDDTGKGIPKEKQASIFENYVQVKETGPEIEGTGLGLGIVQSLVRLMGGEISIVDKGVGEKGTCFRFNVVFKVCVSDLSEDDKTVKSSPPPSSSSSIVVLFISSDERRKMAQKFIAAQGIKVLAVKSIGQLSESLREFRRQEEEQNKSSSDLSLSFGYLNWPTPIPASNGVGVPLSALVGTDVSQTPQRNNNNNQTACRRVPNFILLVIDTTRVDFNELCKAVAEFRKNSKNACSRIVWLGSKCIQLQGLDQKKLPPSDIIIPMPLHGSRLHSLIHLLPEFGGNFPATPPHANHHQITKQEEETESSSNPLRGKKVLVAEDDSLQQMIAKKILLKLSVSFEMCRNGKEAFTMVSEGLSHQTNLGASHILPYEYIFMDCQMPEMDGCEATRLIRVKEKEYEDTKSDSRTPQKKLNDFVK
ncbi:unnamed protein product [Lactuca saligna]|uniref:histidine kinase n=1 Tax=Lactuca saligna TaxID=75948 RepID=A0AA36ELQ6_LACSI|nr:unnamed protein product [Lactuca saligna]